MTIVQLISVAFLVAMIVLVLRGIRTHPRGNRMAELDATGNAGGDGITRMAERLESGTVGSAETSGGGPD